MLDRGWKDEVRSPGLPGVPRGWKRQGGPSSGVPGGSSPS